MKFLEYADFPPSFVEAYNPAEMHVVTPDNYLEYLLT